MPHFVIVLLKSTSASSSRRQKKHVKSENDCITWDFSLALELLITRRSSVQIWLPQPKWKEHSSKWNSWRCKFSCWFAWMFFFYYIMLNAFYQSLWVEFSRLIFYWLENCQVGNGSHSSANPSAWNGRMPIFDRTGLKMFEKFWMPATFLILLAEWDFDIKIEG